MEESSAVRMAGYMEKRGKLKLVSSWKKYWFVLEGQLLLYYKSQLDYINLSACRGSLNIGLASCVRPGHGLTLQVVTRTQCVTLRTKERSLQEQWLQALVDSMALPNTSSLKRNSTGTQHFRYSLDNLPAISELDECSSRESVEKKSTLPRQVSQGDSILHRIQRMGGMSYNTPQGLATRPHVPLTKSLSTPSIQDDETESNSNTKEAFLHNMMTVKNLLDMTSNRSKEEKGRESPNDSKTNDNDLNRVSAEYSELILNETLQDENQNTPQVQEEAKLQQMSENICYESVKQAVDNEDVEYCSYDRVALMKDLMTAEDVEPDLPPRPGKQTVEYEEVAAVEISQEKKYLTLRDKIPLFRENQPSKAIQKSSGQELHVEGKKKAKKRKNSFLNKFVLRLKRKESVEMQVESRDMFEESDEEPVYESVTFVPHPTAVLDPDPVIPLKKQPEPEYETVTFVPHPEADLDPDPEIPLKKQPKKLLGQTLPLNIIHELKAHMGNKPPENDNSEDSDDYDTICLTAQEDDLMPEGQPDSNMATSGTSSANNISSQVAIKSKERIHEHVYAKSKKNNKPIKPTLDIPSLPPRRTHRPTSPWHDVPTNNSPVSPLPPQLTDEQSEVLPIPDNVLNTPQGFQLLKNKWQRAEKSGEWNREHQQVAFPNKTQERILSPSESSNHSIESLVNISNSEKIIANSPEHCDSLEKTTRDETSGYDGFVFNKECSDEVTETTENPFYAIVSHANVTTTDTPPDKNQYLTDNDIYFARIDQSPDLIDLGNSQNNVEAPFFAELSTQTCETEVQHLMDTCIEEEENQVLSLIDADNEIVGINRYSDELHLLLTQLAEITSAPLFHIGATKSLITTSATFSALDAELGPIRRRRHSDPDYDVPRPHQSLFFDQGTPEISMSPDSLEPALDHFITDIC